MHNIKIENKSFCYINNYIPNVLCDCFDDESKYNIQQGLIKIPELSPQAEAGYSIQVVDFQGIQSINIPVVDGKSFFELMGQAHIFPSSWDEPLYAFSFDFLDHIDSIANSNSSMDRIVNIISQSLKNINVEQFYKYIRLISRYYRYMRSQINELQFIKIIIPENLSKLINYINQGICPICCSNSPDLEVGGIGIDGCFKLSNRAITSASGNDSEIEQERHIMKELFIHIDQKEQNISNKYFTKSNDKERVIIYYIHI